MYKLPQLKFKSDELKGFLSADTIETHYDKHHQNYLNKLNEIIAGTEYESWLIEDLIKKVDQLPGAIRQGVINNGGGYFNHNIYWEALSSQPNQRPSGELLADIEAKYGSFEALAEEFKTKAVQIFGSGWLWLMPDLSIVSSSNQDNPLSSTGEMPLFGVDVWEHAYYLDYKNLRADYVEKWWQHLDWQMISERYVR